MWSHKRHKKTFYRSNHKKSPKYRKGNWQQRSEAYRTAISHSQNKISLIHIIINIPENQHNNRILKTVREKKQITVKRKSITVDFLIQTMKSRRAWSEVFQTLI